MMRIIAIILGVSGVYLASRVDEEWAFCLAVALVGFGLGVAEMNGEKRGPKG